MASQNRQRGLFQGAHCPPVSLLVRRARRSRRGNEIFEMERELVHGGLRQVDSRTLAVLPNETAPVGVRGLFARHVPSQAGLTPATCTSAAMKRAQFSRWAASVFRPFSVMR